jgi:ATP-binding cassette, subfamily B, bacterial
MPNAFLRSRLTQALAQLPHLPRALRLVWAAARPWTAAWLCLLLVQGVLPVAVVYLTRALVDGLVGALGAGGGWEQVRPVLLLVGLMAGVMMLGELLRALTGWIRAAQGELVKDHISGLIQQQATAVDLAFYESPDYYDHLHRARAEAGYRPLQLVENLGGLLQNGVTLLAMAAVLLPYGWWLPPLLLAGTLPAFYVVLVHTYRQHQWRQRVTADERRAWYYDWLLSQGEAAAEVRLFRLGPYFRDAFQALRQKLRRERLSLARSQALAELGAGSVALLVTGLALAWMVWRALQGAVTLGDLALFYQAFNQGQRLMRSLMENLGQIYANSLFLGNLFAYLNLRPQVVDPPEAVAGSSLAGAAAAPAAGQPELEAGAMPVSVAFKNVTFCYPGSSRTALADFNLAIPAGQIAAIVGANGAGKSTLLKLLCRFYDPAAGCLEIDGVDVRRLPLAALRRRVTVLFQQPVHYNATAAENIRLGDLGANGHGLPDGRIEEAAAAAGADEPIRRLPRGYDTLLGKWFAGGAELSIGEWQRVALARAFWRRSSLIVLDEPTSAMDSWAEADWMARFRELAAGRTALIITHRFTTAMQADVIHVMDEGRIVESGSHLELLARGGRYAQSWTTQTRGA